MPNIVANADFSDGLTGWTHGSAVALSTDPRTPGVRLPGSAYLAQWIGGAEISSNHLYFFCTPLESTGIRLQVRLGYTDGSQESSVTEAVVESPAYIRIEVPVNDDLSIRQFEIVNMDVHESATVILNFFYLDGELPVDDAAGGGWKRARRGWPVPSRDARLMGTRFLDLEKKLDQILSRLDPERPAVEPKEKAASR